MAVTFGRYPFPISKLDGHLDSAAFSICIWPIRAIPHLPTEQLGLYKLMNGAKPLVET